MPLGCECDVRSSHRLLKGMEMSWGREQGRNGTNSLAVCSWCFEEEGMFCTLETEIDRDQLSIFSFGL